jgi:hypothetical protein
LRNHLETLGKLLGPSNLDNLGFRKIRALPINSRLEMRKRWKKKHGRIKRDR